MQLECSDFLCPPRGGGAGVRNNTTLNGLLSSWAHNPERSTAYSMTGFTYDKMEGKYQTNKRKGPDKSVLGADLHGELITFRLERLT